MTDWLPPVSVFLDCAWEGLRRGGAPVGGVSQEAFPTVTAMSSYLGTSINLVAVMGFLMFTGRPSLRDHSR